MFFFNLKNDLAHSRKERERERVYSEGERERVYSEGERLRETETETGTEGERERERCNYRQKESEGERNFESIWRPRKVGPRTLFPTKT